MNVITKSNPTETCKTIKFGIDTHAKWYYSSRQDHSAPFQPEAMRSDRGPGFQSKFQESVLDEWKRFCL